MVTHPPSWCFNTSTVFSINPLQASFWEVCSFYDFIRHFRDLLPPIVTEFLLASLPRSCLTTLSKLQSDSDLPHFSFQLLHWSLKQALPIQAVTSSSETPCRVPLQPSNLRPCASAPSSVTRNHCVDPSFGFLTISPACGVSGVSGLTRIHFRDPPLLSQQLEAFPQTVL